VDEAPEKRIYHHSKDGDKFKKRTFFGNEDVLTAGQGGTSDKKKKNHRLHHQEGKASSLGGERRRLCSKLPW